MSRLNDLYKAMETLRREGLSFNEDLEKQVSDLEEEIIKNEILPLITETIAPALKQVQRELILVVDYKPDEPISVHLSRKMNLAEALGAKQISTETPKMSEPVRSFEVPEETKSNKPPKQIVNQTKGLRVEFQDGTVLCENSAAETFVKTLRKIGFQRVEQSGIFRAGYGLVSKIERIGRKGVIYQKKVGEYYVYVNMTNQEKMKYLNQLSEMYDLHLIVSEAKL